MQSIVKELSQLVFAQDTRDPSISIEECVLRYGTDTDRVKRFLIRENHQKARPSTDDPAPQIIKRSDSDEDREVPAVADCIQRNSENKDKT